jgi:hypothetical protein
MTCGRACITPHDGTLCGAAASHSAELVRGEFLTAGRRPPHPALRATFSPRGEGSKSVP